MKTFIVKTALSASALALSASLLANPVWADAWSGNVGGYLGTKTLDDKDWPQHDEQDSIGMILDFKQSSWPLSIAVDLFGTGKENTLAGDKNEAYSAEAHIGVRKVFDLDIEDCKFKPYVGGGVALTFAEETELKGSLKRTADDSDNGYWVGVGTYYQVTDSFNLGLDVRVSETELEIFQQQREGGGTLVSLGAGYHW